jgi:predicted ATP-grasp superfamily ATP-dependent carboligase
MQSGNKFVRPRRVLVLDGMTQNGLAMSRSLGRAGHHVGIVARPNSGISGSIRKALRSRFIKDVHEIDLEEGANAYLAALGEIVTAGKYDYVMAAGTRAYNRLSQVKSELSAMTKPLVADWNIVAQLHDKAEFMRLAASEGLPVPRTWLINNYDDLDRAAAEINGPVIVKLRDSFASRGLWTFENGGEAFRAEFLRRYPDVATGAPAPAIVQERIRGKVHDVTTLWHQGREIASLSQLRQLTDWLDGGSGVVNVTNDLPQIRDASRKLLSRLQWDGPLQLEWLEEEGTGRFLLLEANPKFWGTTQLSISAGLDYPAWWVGLHEGVEPQVPPYRRDLMFRWLVKELRTVLTVPRNRARLVREVSEYFARFRHRPRINDFDRGDPLPSLYDWLMLAVDLFLRGGVLKTVRAYRNQLA